MALHTHDGPHAPADAALLPPQADVEQQRIDDMAAPAPAPRMLRLGETRGTYTTGPEQAGDANEKQGQPEPSPIGILMGVAKDVEERLGDAALSATLFKFLSRVKVRSFGDTGWQRKSGKVQPGLWCPFDLGTWAREMGKHRQNVCRMRDQAVALGILFYEPDTSEPGRGRLGWNLDFDQWLPLQDTYRRTRYTREGAGRPKKSNRLHSLADENKSNGLRLVDEEISNRLRTLGENNSNRLRSSDYEEIKLITPDCLESAAIQGAAGALIKVTKKKDTEETDANASGASASPHAPRTGVFDGDGPEGDGPEPEPATPPPHHGNSHSRQSGGDAPTPGAAASPPPPRSRSGSTSRPRKLNDEQLAAHRQEAVWVNALIEAMRQERDVRVLPVEGRERQAAHWFYQQLMGVEDGVSKVMACYRITKRSPFWENRPLSLQKLTECFPDYRRDPAGYKREIEQERVAREMPRSHLARAAPQQAEPRRLRTAASVKPVGWG